MILISHESSGVIRDAFRAVGLEAMSCDLLPTERPGPHFTGDVYKILFTRNWDLIIAHPECTHVCVSGNRHYSGTQKRADALKWTEKFWFDCMLVADRICFENPKGILATHSNLPAPQYVQPYEFGHNASKETGLHLFNLPRLKPTKHIPPEYYHEGLPRWGNQSPCGADKTSPGPDRWKVRSKTYQGIAAAMADQWHPGRIKREPALFDKFATSTD